MQQSPLERAPVFEAARQNANIQPLIDEMYDQAAENWTAITAQIDQTDATEIKQ